MKQIPSADNFVIHLASSDKDESLRNLASLGQIEKLKAQNLMLLRVTQPSSDPKAMWRRISKMLEPTDLAQPVLLDERDYPHYPTGEITVRFNSVLSDKQLEEFAETHGLKLRDRNEFVAEQAVFRPLQPHLTYIPDLVQEIATDNQVRAVWANTLSQYERVQSKR